MPNALKHRGPARDPAEADEEIAPPRAAGAPPVAARAVAARQKDRRAAASASQKRKRVILNLLRAIRAGRLKTSVQLGAWSAALMAARLIADSPDGVALTPEGRAMLKEMSRKHTAAAQAPAPAGPDASPGRMIARKRSRSDREQTTIIASG